MKVNGCLGLILLSVSQMSFSSDAEKDFVGGDFSGRITLASDYVFRGESETADGDIPAVQTDVTWTHSSDTYAGVFVSSNKFTSAPDVNSVVAPYLGKFGDTGLWGIDYNVFIFHYIYPGVSELDYTELWLNASKDFNNTTVGVEITPTLNDWFGVDGWEGVNYALHLKYTLLDQWKLSASVGEQDLNGDGAEGWRHWNTGVNRSFFGFDFDVRYHDSDIDSSHKVYGSPQGLEIFDQRWVFGVSKGF